MCQYYLLDEKSLPWTVIGFSSTDFSNEILELHFYSLHWVLELFVNFGFLFIKILESVILGFIHRVISITQIRCQVVEVPFCDGGSHQIGISKYHWCLKTNRCKCDYHK